jgi:Uma2 family endonuclease
VKIKETAEKYLYMDYAKWNDDNRYELIDGVAYLMSPAPTQAHQDISGELAYQIRAFLKGKPCKVFTAPFDVCLNAAGDNDKTVVQPDILVVCDKSKLDGKRCNGAPDMTIEILSPSSMAHDMIRKHDKYLHAGVREYWIVDPENKVVYVNIFEDGRYTLYEYESEGTVPVRVLDGCSINMSDVFNS